MAFWHPTFVAGKMPQDLHSAGLLVGPYQLHILLFAKRGWGQPWARATGVEGHMTRDMPPAWTFRASSQATNPGPKHSIDPRSISPVPRCAGGSVLQ